MARIQILELPSEQVGEFFSTPFVVIIDRLESEETLVTFEGTKIAAPSGMDEMTVITEVAGQIKEATGAKGIIVYPGEIEVG